MADEGAVGVVEAPLGDVGADAGGGEQFEDTAPVVKEPVKPEDDKQDGRRQPDALRKRIAGLREQAATETDPVRKQSLLDDAKDLNNRVGKVAAYEQHFPTVREAREVKALVESFGGRDGLSKAQDTISRATQIDGWLNAGDKQAADLMWKDSPQGMQKLAPVIFAELEKANPQEYNKAVVPHAVKFFDNSGFPEAFDRMVAAYQGGDKASGDKLSAELARWYSQQRQGVQQAPKTDPETERLQRELQERDKRDNQQAIDRSYNEVVSHAGPVIDKYLKPIVAKLGLSPEQYSALRKDAWAHLQETRNADQTYKTVANAKYAQGIETATTFIKSETETRAEDASRFVANFRYGHQLKNGVVKAPNVTAPPTTPGITKGKEPHPSEVDYSIKGIQAASKLGYRATRDGIGDMILDGKAPLKAGGIRQWR